jgi:hypothetical protein
MRRLSVLALAGAVVTLVFALGVTGATAKVKKKKSFESTVTVVFNQGPPSGEEYEIYASSSFSGKVGSEKAKCVPDRSVTVKRQNGSSAGQAKSNGNGDWTVLAASVTPGQYTVEVAKSKIIKKKTKNNGEKVKKKIVCKPVTKAVTVP